MDEPRNEFERRVDAGLRATTDDGSARLQRVETYFLVGCAVFLAVFVLFGWASPWFLVLVAGAALNPVLRAAASRQARRRARRQG